MPSVAPSQTRQAQTEKAQTEQAEAEKAEAEQVEAKQALAHHALAHHLKAAMTLGLGSGTTAEAFIEALAADKAKRPRLCIASSAASHRLAASLDLPVLSPAAFFAEGSPPPCSI